VGLAVLRFNEKPGAVTESMADSRALSYGLIGLLVRDFVYAATGIPLPALDHNTDGAWIDRAGLMEDAWNIAGRAPGTTTWQDVQFSGPTAGRADPRQPITGSLILNSMSVGNACRIWVSEMELIPEATGAPPRSSDEKLDCDQAFMPGVRSVDLISRYGAFGSAEHPGSGAAGCLYGLTASTAALLAARFPYVTPSGHVGECARQSGISPVDQLVDGGYLENTGLGTINDLADTWLDTVLAWNTEQLRQQHPHLLVPLVAYLDNDSGTDKSAAKRDISNEFLLPPLARLRAGSGAVADEANLQRSSDLVAPDRICPLGDSDCIQAVESIPGRIYDVYPASRPQISAPLGWVLSTVSREAIADALNQQERTPCYLDPATRSLRTVCARATAH
jgi:hypothetical protein